METGIYERYHIQGEEPKSDSLPLAQNKPKSISKKELGLLKDRLELEGVLRQLDDPIVHLQELIEEYDSTEPKPFEELLDVQIYKNSVYSAVSTNFDWTRTQKEPRILQKKHKGCQGKYARENKFNDIRTCGQKSMSRECRYCNGTTLIQVSERHAININAYICKYPI